MKSFWFVIILLCQGTIDCSKNLQIIGSNKTALASLYVVSIQYQAFHVCVGSIVATTWVLTAAVCFQWNIKDYTIRYGVLDCYDIDNINGTERSIDDIELSNPNGLALLKVNTEFDTNLYILLAPLPNSEYFQPIHEKALLFGWDFGEFNRPNFLKVGKFVINVGPVVIKNHRETWYEFNAGGKGTGISQGNIGSPLIDEYLLIGIASDISMFDGVTPDIFYKVSSFLPWIRRIIG